MKTKFNFCNIKKFINKKGLIISTISLIKNVDSEYIGEYSLSNNYNIETSGFYKIKVGNRVILGYAYDDHLTKI
jgi:hypothetical protein